MSSRDQFIKVKQASRELVSTADDRINQLLVELSSDIISGIPLLLLENQRDLDRMDANDPKYDRLKLTGQRIKDISDSLIQLSKLKSPIGEILTERTMPNGLKLLKKRVPMGVIGIIYESRPNVTIDVFALCIKTKNACILKGGKEAEHSNNAITGIIKNALRKNKINEDVIQLLDGGREATGELLNAISFVDLIIPRGSQGLIDYVRQNSRIPIIETGAGIVHVYYDEFADKTIGINAVYNSKTRRVSVCNALDCLVIYEKRINDLTDIALKLKENNVEIYADEKAYKILKDTYPANLLFPAKEEHYGTEFLSYKLAVKTVNNLDEAIDHISKYSSKHSEAIISGNNENIEEFMNRVDAAVVYSNTSTAFTDGGEFGLGAEIGISTQKMHARGPMGLEEITSYKWIVYGTGQVRK